MRKALLLLTALFATGSLMAQTPKMVSTEPSNRNVILEEYTGYHCTWCPVGHQRANEMCAENEGHAWAINIHTGSFATGSGYETEYGTALMNQTGLTGFPSGTVNRHVFSGTKTIIDYNSFSSAATTIRAMASPVNVAAKASIDETTRELSIDIEVYYTDDATNETNKLNVALLQNNIMGSQTGMDKYPEMVENGKYRHMHMLRDMITGQWGVDIPATKGTFFDTTIVYTVPESIGSVEIGDNFADLQVIVFIAEGKQEILTGTEAIILTDKAQFSKIDMNQQCGVEFEPEVTVFNSTLDTISKLTFTYEGTDYDFEQTIYPLQGASFQLPTYTIDFATTGTVNVKTTKEATLKSYIKNADEEEVSVDATRSVTFADFNIYNVNGPFNLRFGYDFYGSECSMEFLNTASDCEADWTAGPWKDITWINPNSIQYINQIPNATYDEIDFSPEKAGLYVLRLHDGYGDGWSFTNDDQVSGLWMSNADGEFITENWGYTKAPQFSTLDFYINVLNDGDGSYNLGVEDAPLTVDFNVYPNPTHGQLVINASEPVRMVEIIDINGRTVMTLGANTTKVNAQSLNNGVYVIRVTTDNGIGMQKFVKE